MPIRGTCDRQSYEVWRTAELDAWSRALNVIVAHAVAHPSAPSMVDLDKLINERRPRTHMPYQSPLAPTLDDINSNSGPLSLPAPPRGEEAEDLQGPRPMGGKFDLRDRKRRIAAGVIAAIPSPPDPPCECSTADRLMDELCNVAIDDAQSALAAFSYGDAATILFGSQEQRWSCELFVAEADAVTSATHDFKGHARAMRMDKERWTAAELKELESHTCNGSWLLMGHSDLPRDGNIKTSVWVYKVKRDG
ncbi:MAG: hypothetical protein SGPRY_004860, partial [Prymnesium sp.]